LDHIVKQGDCLSSIAARYGFTWQTLWNDAANADLKKRRKDPNILFVGDVVVVPDSKVRKESCASGSLHEFVCKATAEPIRIRFLDELDKPIANAKYELVVDGKTRTGNTNGDGELTEKIGTGVKTARLFLGDDRREYTIQVGGLDPVTEIVGVQQRLSNLGYTPGKIDGINGPHTSAALGEFQADNGLEPTGELDDDTIKALQDRHGR
jgi:hypothetical protein